jgi:hypothetical protein
MLKPNCICLECQKENSRTRAERAITKVNGNTYRTRYPMLNTWDSKEFVNSMGQMNPHHKKINN